MEAANMIVITLWASIVGFSLIAWIMSMRRKIKKSEQFRRGVEALLRNGVVPSMDRVHHQETEDGFVVSFEGPYGSTGPRHEAKVTTTKSGRDEWQIDSVAKAT